MILYSLNLSLTVFCELSLMNQFVKTVNYYCLSQYKKINGTLKLSPAHMFERSKCCILIQENTKLK